MLLWLDDERPSPPGWTWVKNVGEAAAILRDYPVAYASLDYDLGWGESKGLKLIHWMAQTGNWPAYRPGVHSANLRGAAKMVAAIIAYGPYK